MNMILRSALAIAAVVMSAQAVAQVTFYENENFRGRSYTTDREIENIRSGGFNNRASSIVVTNDRWTVCENAQFGGRCATLRPGRYPSVAAMGLNGRVSSVRMADRNEGRDNRYGNEGRDDNRNGRAPVAAASPNETSQITFYENEDFQGRSFSTDRELGSFMRNGFNDRASSIVVVSDQWVVCEDVQFGGRCAILRPGRYPSLQAMGLNDRISSVRTASGNERVDEGRYAPAPAASYDARRRNNERLYEANVTAVRAVLGTPGQRCWVEREQVSQERSSANIPGAVAGALIGGILGHQIGNGRGNDIATVGGAVAGAAVGANVGRDSGGQQVATQDVQHCANEPSQAKPDYWDVTYNFRGQDHRVQMTTSPGRTITVNEQGEPRA